MKDILIVLSVILMTGIYGSEELQVDKRAMMEGVAQVKSMANAFSARIGSIPMLHPVQSSPISVIEQCLGYSRPGRREIQYAKKLVVEKRASKKLANRDFVFILDTSGSILGSEFNLAKEAVASLLEAFCPVDFGHATTVKGSKQMAMVLFGSSVTKVIDFSDSHKGLRYMQDKIMAIKHRRESMTSTAEALKYVRESILGKGLSRLNDPKVSTDVIIITDGRCNVNCKKMPTVADEIRRMGHGVNVFAVGVAQARECELDILSGREPQMAFGLKSMASFRAMAMGMRIKARKLPNLCV